ncbi:hypothetical protein F4808DRAFT_469104 [Astrocystis sublimbata]|nr:hypothetical protein F4808DRAFT_469104 [Astrocystis sublimbata]
MAAGTRPANHGFVERSRRDRRLELARLARERHADLSVVLGLSVRVGDHQVHGDYTGGVDAGGLVASLGRLVLGWALPWRGRTEERDMRKEAEAEAGVRGQVQGGDGLGRDGCRSERDVALSGAKAWRDAVVAAAPVDFQVPRRFLASSLSSSPSASVGVEVETGAPQGVEIEMQADEERRARDFARVIARVDTDALARLARNLLVEHRRRQFAARSSSTLAEAVAAVPPDSVLLPKIGEPFFGGGHVFYLVEFPPRMRRNGRGRNAKGVKWIVKIPAMKCRVDDEGDGWDDLCRETLRAEALLLHMLRTETQIPVPAVIDADCSVDNDVGAPWLLMEFVQGRRLEDVWFGLDGSDESRRGKGIDEHLLRERREMILTNLANAMLQLGKYTFARGGALVFDQHNGELVGTGPLRILDIQAMVDRWFADEACETTPIYRAAGPWDDTGDVYTACLDAYPSTSVSSTGANELIKLLLGHIREPGSCREIKSRKGKEKVKKIVGGGVDRDEKEKPKGFVLMHADLSMRHIILDQDGTTIKAILGWDAARAAPRSIGNEALPAWLVRDFNPFLYRWRPPDDVRRNGRRGVSMTLEGNRFEDSPWTLRELREFYAGVMMELKMHRRPRKQGREGNDDDQYGAQEDSDVNITKQSLLAMTLHTAIRDPRCRVAALRRLLEKCSRPFETFDFDYFVEVLGEEYQADSVQLRCLEKNLRELVDKGFVKGAVAW